MENKVMFGIRTNNTTKQEFINKAKSLDLSYGDFLEMLIIHYDSSNNQFKSLANDINRLVDQNATMMKQISELIQEKNLATERYRILHDYATLLVKGNSTLPTSEEGIKKYVTSKSKYEKYIEPK